MAICKQCASDIQDAARAEMMVHPCEGLRDLDQGSHLGNFQTHCLPGLWVHGVRLSRG